MEKVIHKLEGLKIEAITIYLKSEDVRSFSWLGLWNLEYIKLDIFSPLPVGRPDLLSNYMAAELSVPDRVKSAFIVEV